MRVYKEEKNRRTRKKKPAFFLLKKKGGPGETVKPNYVRREEEKKSDKKRMPNRISGGKAVVSTLQLCKTGAENEGDGKKKTALRACQQS